MNKFYTIFVYLVFSFGLTAQSFHNEWIDFGKPYHKVKVTENGVYKIAASEINKVSGANVNNLSVLRRGKQVPVLTVDLNGNGLFDNEDYVLFIGKKNDGLQDSALYNFPKRYPNPHRALHSDTAVYFLTTATNPKRVLQNVAFETASNVPFVVYDSIQSFMSRYEHGERIANYNDPIARSDYSNLEGFVNVVEDINHVFNLPNNFVGTAAYWPRFESTIVPTRVQPSRAGNLTQRLLTANGSTVIGTYSFMSNNNLAFFNEARIPLSAILNNQITINCQASNSNHNTFSFSYVRWKFPVRDTALRSFQIWELPNELAGKWNLNKIQSGMSVWVENEQYTYAAPRNAQSFFVNNPSSGSQLYVFDERNARNLTLEKVAIKEYSTTSDSLFLIVSHRLVNRPHQGVQQPVYEYAKYKKSKQGGGFDTMVVFVEDLYEQYTYGEKSPLALRRLIEQMCSGEFTPAYLFLIGKGFELTASTRQRNGRNEIDLLPTWGNPGSDYMFSVGLKGRNRATQAIPTGRLVAYGPEEVLSYLNKMKEHDQVLGTELWRKNVLHLTGGRTSGEIATFRNFGLQMSERVSSNYFGARSQVFSKTTGEAVQLFNVSEEVNNGLSLILFHGHSSPGVSDINIGYVTNPSLNYQNKGKYPIIILNGCESGNVFIERDGVFGVTFGENWVVTPDKGAINFLGHSNFGFDSNLRTYGTLIYQQWFGDSAQTHWSIGKILQKVNSVFIQNFETAAQLNIAQATQFVLQGDPSVKIFPQSLPDYRINPNRIQVSSFDESIITSLTDSFYVRLPIENAGIYPLNQKVEILIRRVLPNGQVVNYPVFFASNIKLSESFQFTIPLADLDFASVGENTLEIIIDPQNKIAEINKENNRVSVKFFIYPSGLTCLLPAEFSIQSSKTVSLVAQSSDLLRMSTPYLFEIDTTVLFNSPLKKTQVVSGAALATWGNLDLETVFQGLEDSTVFYWKVSFNNPSESNSLFAQSSFVYIGDSPEGWAQHHYYQFDKNTLDGLSRDPLQRLNLLESEKLNLEIEIGKDQMMVGHQYKFIANNEVLIQSPCGYNDQGYDPGDDGFYMAGIRRSDLSLVVIDNIVKNGLIKANGIGGGALFCSEKTDALYRIFPYSFNYWFDEGFTYYASTDDMLTFLNRFFNALNDGDYIVMFSTGRPQVEKWDPRVVDLIRQNIVSDQFMKLGDKAQMIYFGRKNIGAIQEVVTDTLNTDEDYASIVLRDSIETGAGSGKIISTLIGPSENWDKLFRKVSNVDMNGENWGISVAGVTLDNQETVIATNITSNEFDLSSLSADEFPYLRLTGNFSDEINFVPSQLESWIVTYQNTTPEGLLVLNDSDGTYSNIPFIQEGATYSLPFVFRNISNFTFSSPLVVEYNIRNTNNGENRVIRDTIHQSLAANSQLIIQPRIPTLGLVGNNTFQIFVNPRAQKEVNYLNNIWTTRFIVLKDTVNPLIGLAIDGRRITNGEIVSPSPLIELYIKDENPYKRKTDTSSVRFLLKKNCLTCDFERLTMLRNNYNISYRGDNQSVTVISIRPEDLEDGSYTLCVEGADASDNMAGTRPYCIEFTVARTPGVSFFVPIPNPFVEQVRFAYLLHGSQVPEEVNVYILNTTGQVVRKLTQNELGTPRIGNNLTNAWDGKDQNGNYLSSGLYYFKSEVKLGGQLLPQLATDVDGKTVNGYGKIVIVR